MTCKKTASIRTVLKGTTRLEIDLYKYNLATNSMRMSNDILEGKAKYEPLCTEKDYAMCECDRLFRLQLTGNEVESTYLLKSERGTICSRL